ncbi:MAG TPA: hypothetical protein VJW23_11925 [Propionibacteriaceae bacterium]|nr:hypothetical protein [Propionibacteriaceae bacterium]
MTQQFQGPASELVGSWRKADAPSCAEKYPEWLTFSTGTYRGLRGERQGFIWWDAGTYRIESYRRILLSVATDELVAYEIRLTGDVLAFVDSDGCRFTYQRVPPPS